MPTSQRDPLSPIQHPDDRQALRAESLFSIGEIWRRIGQDDGALFRSFPADRRARVLRDLFQAARREATEKEKGGWSRFWPDVLLVASMLLLLGLGVRAARLGDSVAVALSDLRAGERLRSEKLHGAEGLDLPDGKQPGPALRLIRNVPAGDYIFPEDLERFEVVAAVRIARGDAIPADAVRQEWRRYSKAPAALPEQVVGNLATDEIERGATIRPEQLESESVLVEQVVANRRLPRLHPITAADFRREKRPRQPGALLKDEDAIGHYPLQEIEAGTTLVQGSLSPGAVAPGSLAGRQILTLDVQPPSFRLVPQLPAHVGLAATAPGDRKLLLTDVIVLAVEPGKDGPALVVALTEADLQGLVPLLPEAQVFVLQTAP